MPSRKTIKLRKTMKLHKRKQRGAGCGCGNTALGKIGGARGGSAFGGYKPTNKNLATLRRFRRGESIGFTATSSLKAKGLIPRTSNKNKGKFIVSPKYAAAGGSCDLQGQCGTA
jgi:hypothetical protein